MSLKSGILGPPSHIELFKLVNNAKKAKWKGSLTFLHLMVTFFKKSRMKNGKCHLENRYIFQDVSWFYLVNYLCTESNSNFKKGNSLGPLASWPSFMPGENHVICIAKYSTLKFPMFCFFEFAFLFSPLKFDWYQHTI